MTKLIDLTAPKNPIPWLSPTPEMQITIEFEAIWNCIKTWDINVPEAYGGYCEANGNHVRAILDAIEAATWFPMEKADKKQDSIILHWEGYPPMEGCWNRDLKRWYAFGSPSPKSQPKRWRHMPRPPHIEVAR